MPNHVVNHISLQGDPEKIRSMLEAIKSDELGIGSVDFNKIIPMPKSLNIEAGSRTDRGLQAYRDFIDVYTFARSINDTAKALENIPVESEEVFLRNLAEPHGTISENTAPPHGTIGVSRIGEQNGMPTGTMRTVQIITMVIVCAFKRHGLHRILSSKN